MPGDTVFHYDAEGNKVLSVVKDVPEDVRLSEFGCLNCLYQGAECKRGSRYEPTDQRPFGQPTCASYAYYD
jgi:hypothetical protein